MIRRDSPMPEARRAWCLNVDHVPVSSKRERNVRNGFANVAGGLSRPSAPYKPSILLESTSHPTRLRIVEYLRHGGGTPMLGNWHLTAPRSDKAERCYNIPVRS